MNREILYQGNSIITVETHPDYALPVVIKIPSKRPPSQRSLRSLENEYQMTRTLDRVAGVRKALGQQSIEDQPTLILEYIEGETLRETIERKELDLRSKLEIALDLARILGEIHQQNVIHLDFNSMNILIGKDQEAVQIIDLGSAVYIDRSGYQKVRPDQLLGTLPYISPEHTGRINRAVDERSDLYSLGVVLYELMTGQLPFDSKDQLEIVHDHLARVPNSPSKVSPEIPEVLSAIILKLLSKNAEDRYQSAAGVQADLEKCLQRLSPEDTIEGFPLGENDYASRLRFPQKLYGRDRELDELERAFESVCQDTSSIMFIGGYSGIGKTALIEELQRPVSEKGGYFIQGKFDQLATTPYAGVTQALARFVSQILTQTETQLAAWRSRILEAVGPNGRVLTNVVPSLELVIGPQPAVPDLSGQKAQNRFNYVFQSFFGAIARREHPICFFLDDLQWIDPASLGLLKNLFSSPDLAHLLVVGAYRDNEVDEAHPLMTFIADLEKAGVNLRRMTLQKLAEADVEAMISDLLRRDPGVIRELSRLVYSQIDGNPFFTRQVLHSMEDQGLIALDTATGHWRWDMDSLRDLDFTDNVVELLVGRLRELPEDIQETLKVAACIGNQFDISTLTVVTAGENETILDHFQDAVVAGLIWERDDRGFFVHDRVQEAAYTLMPPEDRDRTHLTIGRLLLADTDDIDREERIFDIANHYNLGSNLLTDPAERLELVRLNLAAGRKARVAAAFGASAAYLKQGLTLLGKGAWQNQYGLTLDVHSELIEVCYLNIQHKDVEGLFDSITHNAKREVDASVGYQALITSCIARHELGRAISLAERYLERLDVPLENERESDLTIAELYELPQMENREKLAAMEILMAMVTPVLFSEPERLPSVVYTMLNLIRRYGNNSISAFAYASYAYTLCLMQRYQEGNRFGQLVVDLLEKYPHPDRAAGIMNTLYTNVRHWRQPIHDQITPLKTCHRMAMQAGDFEYGLYSLLNHTLLLWGSGKHLEHCLAEVELTISLSESKNQQVSLQAALMLAQLALNLTGRSPNTTQLEGKWFSEETMLSRLEGNHYLLALYKLLKMMLCYLFGDPGAAYGQTQDVLKYRGSLNPSYLYTKNPFYGALSCIAGLTDEESDADREKRLERLAIFEEELKLWAESAPMNYQHLYDLVMAEQDRVSEEHWEATQLYEKAIRGAHENLFVHDQALANELFGRFWLEQGNDRIAEMYMREASALYHKWGAAAKVTHLEDSYPRWFKTETAPKEQPDTTGKITTSITRPITSIQLDLDSITRASQLLAAETNLNQLCTKMLNLVMANSGAAKAVLLLKQDDDWFVQAQKEITTDEPGVLFHQPFDPADRETELIPESIFNYCQRMKNVLVLGDGQLDHRFAQDKMVKKQKIRSLACIPAFSQGEIRALLYLENSQTADVFTHENVGVLKHLSAQFAISMENALLYDNLNQKVRELQESEEEILKHRGQLEAKVSERTRDLNERVKELNCLFGISRLAVEHGNSLEQILEGVVNLLPPAMQHPEIASARIVLNGQEFKTNNFQETPWRQNSAIVVQGEQAGQVVVAYLEERLNEDERPFLNEERLLLEYVAERLGRIIERLRAQQEVAYERELTQSILDTAVDTITVIEPHTLRYLKWNRAATRLTGFSDEEFPTLHPLKNFFDETELPRVEAAVEELMREGAVTLSATHINKDGTTTPLEYTGTVSRDKEGNPQYLIFIGRDITKRKQSEAALRESEEQYRDLVEKISDVIYRIDVNGVITYLNPAVEKLIGLPPVEIVGQPFTQFIHPEDLGHMQNSLQKLLGGMAPGPMEYRVLNASGETRWIRVSSQPIMDEEHISGLQGVLTDTTERKEIESRIKQIAALAERERLARRLHDAVTQTLFSASVIAESTPRIMVNDPELGKRNLEQLSIMLRGALAEMRTMLIELRPEALAGKQLDELMGTLVDASQIRIDCPVDLVINGEDTLPEDVTIVFYRVAQEALSNIIKYAEADEVNIKLDNSEDGVVMTVKDNGRGFERVNIQPGHFGLKMMAERVDQIGGELSIDSNPGHGTQITASWSELGKEASHE